MSENTNNLHELHIKDSREILSVFPKETTGEPKKVVDVTITSPPYHDLKNYGFENQIGYGQTYDEYLEDLTKIFTDIYKITKDSGSLWVVADCFKKGGEVVQFPFELQTAISKCGWILKDIIIWKKDKTLPWSCKGKLRSIFEYVLFFVKTDEFKYNIDRIRIPDTSQFKKWWVKYPERYNPMGKAPTNLWEYSIPVQGWGKNLLRHFCPFPPGLVERIVLLTTDEGDTVLDPFSGSGMVLAVADSMKRRYVGFELNKKFIERFHPLKTKIGGEVDKQAEKFANFEKAQSELKDLNLRLRAVKFPKTLFRKLYSSGLLKEKTFKINTIFVYSKNLENEQNQQKQKKYISEDISIILDATESFDKEKFLKELENIASKAPLSQFGIDPTFQVYTHSEFKKKHESSNTFENKELYLYLKGITNKFEKSITLKEWEKQSSESNWKKCSSNRVPPIISNVKVFQEVINN